MYAIIDGVKDVITSIEENICNDIDINKVCEKAFISTFYFQKIFNALCGYSICEYIRNRRLSLAGEELSTTDSKVIEVALKYGYESPDSFAKAFYKFHGINPSEAKAKGMRLKSFPQLKIKLTLEGGTMLEYKIVNKEQFTVVGKTKRFNIDSSYAEIPQFWQEQMSNKDDEICGMYGICFDSDGKNFEYMIADNYLPWNEVKEGLITKVIEAHTYAVFPCRGKLPEAIQSVNTQIWSEWLPSCKTYKLSSNFNIEMYTPVQCNPDDNYSEIWVPIEKIN